MHVPAATSHDARRVRLWSLREDVHVESDSAGDSLVLHTRWGDTRVWRPGETVREALRRMALGPISLDNVVDGLPARHLAPGGGVSVRSVELARLRTLLDHVSYAVVRSLALEDTQQPLLSAVPIAADASLRPRPLPEHRPVRLSRFAVLRTDGGVLVLESPLSVYRVVFPRPEAVWVVGALGGRTTLKAVAGALPLPEPVIGEILSYLWAAGMLVLGDGDVGDESDHGFCEDTDPALAAWSHHDLLFHSRSRLGRHDGEFGATYRHAGHFGPEPAVKPLPDGPRIPLFRPDLERTSAADPPLTAVLEARRSIRAYADRPMTAGELGELLYRVARVRSTHTTGEPPTTHEISNRPYPGGGAAYELEFYITVNRCDGIPRGVHYYDPEGHALVLVNEDERAVREMLDGARVAADTGEPPPVLITMTARFRRLSWKYSGLSYALTLKHVGVVQQTLYLVATAMGLAPCALGSGDSDLAARTCGLDWRVESSVGEFIVGPAPELAGAGARAVKSFSADSTRLRTPADTIAGVAVQARREDG